MKSHGKFVLYTNVVSAHQLPLAHELRAKVGDGCFQYVYTGDCDGVSQEVDFDAEWVNKADGDDPSFCGAATVLVGGIRPIDMMERQLQSGGRVFYMSERWFKPIKSLPGWVRLLWPRYWLMARRFARLFKYPDYRFLPIGPWALSDMRLVCRLMRVNISPNQIVPWGYFVEPSSKVQALCRPKMQKPVRIIWVGRMLRWKRVDTIIRAVCSLDNADYTLTLVGGGESRAYLEKLAGKSSNIVFMDFVPIGKVRELMRGHDIYVLSSDATEGWGAALNEAMAEGVSVLGTYEAGASAALLPESHLFHAGDWRRLAMLIRNMPARLDLPHDYTPSAAADRLLAQ